MAELLLELFSEEIPARMQARAMADLERLVVQALAEAGLAHGTVLRHATPRRLCLAIDGLAVGQADRSIERRGPRIDAPEKARAGFLGSLGAADYELDEVEDKKGRFILARYVEKGRPTADILAEAIPEILRGFPWPKAMRWGSGEARWVRPLQGILCVLDGRVVPFSFAGIESGKTTRGHRFLAAQPFDVASFAEYERGLEKAHVVLDTAARRETIALEAVRLAEAEGLRLRADDRLLDEVAGLVEWPAPLLGKIDAAFIMELPEEVLVTSMREHQKYLALEDDAGRLAPFFIAVANITAPDGGATIVDGNERVLRARLWDARFFWDQDRKVTLEDRLQALEPMILHEKLGTIRHKVDRIEKLARELAGPCAAEPDLAARAARLAKADLVTGMVGEFPELQGVMGGHYARSEGLPEAVARAIGEHYRPQGPADGCPTAAESVAVALADKLDTIAGFFAAGIRPTGSKDPFALRRAALSIIRLVTENGIRLDLTDAFAAALSGYDDIVAHDGNAVSAELFEFFTERLAVQQREAGIRHDVLRAVRNSSQKRDLVDLIARAGALQALLASEDGENLLAAYRRAGNVVKIELDKDGVDDFGTAVDREAMVAREERELLDALMNAREPLETGFIAERYDRVMATLASLRPRIDAFFDHVMVNSDDPTLRSNRLRLLTLFLRDFSRVADFSSIED